jgi:hypothetical protein
MSRLHYQKGPSPLTVVLIGMVFVFGGYLMWTGLIDWFDEGNQNNVSQNSTQAAESTETSQFFSNQPTVQFFPTPTPIPDCQAFYVRGPQAAFVRECPNANCVDIAYVDPDIDVCVIERANDPEYSQSEEWYKIIIDPEEIFAEFGYMHESVLRSRNPTATPANTFAPFPTVTLTPTDEPTLTPTLVAE